MLAFKRRLCIKYLPLSLNPLEVKMKVTRGPIKSCKEITNEGNGVTKISGRVKEIANELHISLNEVAFNHRTQAFIFETV